MDRRLPARDRTALQLLKRSHLTEDALEMYSLGRLSSEEDIAVVEEHILVCGHCLTRLETMDSFVQAAVAGATAVAANPEPNRPVNYLPIALAASAAAIFLVPGLIQQTAEPANIDLVAVRNETKIRAPAGRTLQLKPDLTGLTETGYDWELSGIDGQLKMRGKLDLATGKLRISGLSADQYWLRLKAAGHQDILREFSLLVQ